MQISDVYTWIVERKDRRTVLLSLRQPMTAKQVGKKTRLSPDTASHLLRRMAAKEFHPDAPGSASRDRNQDRMVAVNAAYTEALRALDAGGPFDRVSIQTATDRSAALRTVGALTPRERDRVAHRLVKAGQALMNEAFAIIVRPYSVETNSQVVADACAKLYRAQQLYSLVTTDLSGSVWHHDAVNRIRWAGNVSARLTRRFLSESREISTDMRVDSEQN